MAGDVDLVKLGEILARFLREEGPDAYAGLVGHDLVLDGRIELSDQEVSAVRTCRRQSNS